MRKIILRFVLATSLVLTLSACNLLPFSKGEETPEVIEENTNIGDKKPQEAIVEEPAQEEEGKEASQNDIDDEELKTVDLSNVKVGDTVTFGKYDQDGDETNGSEPIEWEVLEVSNNRALLISKYVLDCKAYNEEGVDVTWETCTLRSWMNGEFFSAAFNEAEKSKIAETTLSNPDTEWKRANGADVIDGGNDTNDKVFLLSLEEIYKYYGNDWFEEEYGEGACEKLIAPATQTAIKNEVYSANNGADWWLRSPGMNANYACFVSYDGRAGWFKCDIVDCNNDYGVRPAIYVEY